MNKDLIILRNPRLRCRSEEFGGILRLGLKTLIINKKQYEFLDKMIFAVYNDLNDAERRMADKFLEEKVLLRIDMKRARELGFKG